jgi:hypothetical protein
LAKIVAKILPKIVLSRRREVSAQQTRLAELHTAGCMNPLAAGV